VCAQLRPQKTFGGALQPLGRQSTITLRIEIWMSSYVLDNGVLGVFWVSFLRLSKRFLNKSRPSFFSCSTVMTRKVDVDISGAESPQCFCPGLVLFVQESCPMRNRGACRRKIMTLG